MTNNRTETQEFKQEFLRMASYIDCLLECSDTQKETLMNFISRLSEYMPWYEDDDFEIEEHTPEHTEIIMCRDCENHHTEDCPMTFEEDISWDDDGYIEYDTVFHDNAEDDGYCHMGKRREDDTRKTESD